MTVQSGDFSDAELLNKLSEGSEEAFAQLYQLHSNKLYNNILYLVKDAEVAKELLQDLYMKIWEGRVNINPEKPFKSYLFMIARNLVYDYFRRVSLNKKMIVKMMADASAFSNYTDDLIDFKESSATLEKAIDTLPAQSKKVFVLCKMDGKTHEEISAELGISISTVNNHMVKANKIVRDYLLKNNDLLAALIVSSLIKML